MKIKKILASVLAISTVMCITGNCVLAYNTTDTTVTAVETGRSLLRYAHISSFTPKITSSGTIKVSLTLYENLDYSMTLELQQYIGGSWETIDSWDADGNGRGSISETCSLESGKKYRACASVTVYNDNGNTVESTTKYSTSVTAS